jgi:hypothetical protein
MHFQSKLFQRRAAAQGGVTLNKIYDVYIKPDGRVEGEGADVGEALDRAERGSGQAAVAQVQSESFIKGVPRQEAVGLELELELLLQLRAVEGQSVRVGVKCNRL